MEGLTTRPAAPQDFERAWSIVNEPPSRESIGMAGDARRAVAVGNVLARHGLGIDISQTTLAMLDGQIVGVLEAYGAEHHRKIAPLTVLRLIPRAIRLLGPRQTLWLPAALRARGRVNCPPVPGSYYIAEIDVDERYRNRGIGGVLLRHAEEAARAAGHKQMSLTTAITNPAQHLYERHGYRVVETKTDAAFERITGIPGRVLMVKDLT